MSAKLYTVKLTKLEIEVIGDALNAALAGEYGDGDLCWTETKANAARRANQKLPITDSEEQQ